MHIMNHSNSCWSINVTESKEILDNFVTSCSPFTIILNLFVLYLAFNYVNLNQHLEQLFVISMTVADLIFGLVYMSTFKVNLNIPWFFCRPYYITVWTCSIASVMFLLLLNIHKGVILFFPIHSFMYMSKKKVFLQVGLCWSGVLLCSIMFAVEPTMTHLEGTCYPCMIRIDPKSYLFMVICFYILPLLISLILSIMIFGFAQKRSSRSKKRSVNGQNDTRKMLKRIFFVFTSTIWTAMTLLPYRLTFSKIELCKIIFDKDWKMCSNDSLVLLQYCLLFLLTFSTVVNPLITIFTQKAYRKGVLDIWKKLFICTKNETNHNSYKYSRKPTIQAANGDVGNAEVVTSEELVQYTEDNKL